MCLEVLKVLVRLTAPEHTPDEKRGDKDTCDFTCPTPARTGEILEAKKHVTFSFTHSRKVNRTRETGEWRKRLANSLEERKLVKQSCYVKSAFYFSLGLAVR